MLKRGYAEKGICALSQPLPVTYTPVLFDAKLILRLYVDE
jgi:hypothetical protein